MKLVPRLFKKFVPQGYDLSLTLDRTGRKFSGTVIINGEVQPGEKTISLHSKHLEIETVLVDGKKAEFSFHDNDELLITHPDIAIGNHIIVVGFNGKITDSMHGLYPCYYQHNATKKELLTTQFESHHAREVFPCIDEPEAKATFDLTLTTEPDVTVLSNMPMSKQRIENDLLVTTFEKTPRMSSYLLAWVVGELQKKSAKTKSGVDINVWATPAQDPQSLDFALDIATRTTDFFDEYFDTPYPLPKCDHVALPDFSSAAMENWGLVTYREMALLAEPLVSSISSKRLIAIVVAHEISHQWFGNLVTMKWWDDLWLNESFATLIEYVAVDALEPKWQIWFEYMTDNTIGALRRDSLEGVQAVRTGVNHPDEINTLFDSAIVYAKGSRLLQMMEHYIGEAAFKSGLKTYFNKYAYQNTDSDDLWAALGNASHRDIRSFMDKWLDQPGYPVLQVSKTGDKVTLRQERLTSKSVPKTDSLWPIPLNSNCPDMPEMFDKRQLEIETKFKDTIFFNVGGHGHFITHYDDGMLRQIIGDLKAGKLSEIDRLQLLSEQNILASVGHISNANLIPLILAYENEIGEPVWEIISSSIGSLKKFVDMDDAAESKLRQLSGKVSEHEYRRLGWESKPNEPESDCKLRTTIIGLTLFSENSQAIKTARQQFDENPVEKLNPELRPLILSSVIRYSDDKLLVNKLLDVYKSTSSSELKSDICSGLTSTRLEPIAVMLLDCLKNSDIVRQQDLFRWIFFLLVNKYTRNLAWEWLRDNWGWIEEMCSSDKSYDDFPRLAAAALNSRKQLEEFKEFFEPKLNIPALARVITTGINEISARVDLIEQDGKKVRKALLDL